MTYTRLREFLRGGVTNSDNAGQGGGGVWKSIIWPDILCEWPLTIFGTYLQTKLKNIDIVEHLHAFKIIV